MDFGETACGVDQYTAWWLNRSISASLVPIGEHSNDVLLHMLRQSSYNGMSPRAERSRPVASYPLSIRYLGVE